MEMRTILSLSVYLLSAIVLSVVKADVVHLPLRRHHRPVVHAGIAVSRGHQNTSDSGPFDPAQTLQDEVFTVDLSLGTPARNFNATLDYGRYFSVFFGAGKASSPCSGAAKAPLASRRYYDPGASSSAKKNPQSDTLSTMTFKEPYVEAGCSSFYETGTFYNDSLKIGGVLGTVAFVFMQTSIGVVNNAWPSDAILGLSRPYITMTEWLPLCAICDIVKPLDMNIFTVYYGSQGTGRLTLGGVDTDNCDSTWTYTRNRNGWQLETAFSFGKYSYASRMDAYLVSTTAFITTPNIDIFYAVVKATGAEYDFKSDTYVVACDRIAQFPDMVFGMFGKLLDYNDNFDYRLPAKDYVRKLPHNTQGQCTLMLYKGDGGEEGKWILGLAFARSYCTLFNLDTMDVAFAKALH